MSTQISAETPVTGRKRAEKGRRWSATSTVERYHANGNKLDHASTVTPAKLIVRWRCDGKQRSQTFAGHDVDGVEEFQALLAAAYAGNWAPLDYGRPPIPNRVPAPAASVADPAPEPEVLLTVPKASVTSPVGGDDVESLVEWFKNRQQTQKSKRGAKRSPKTLDNYFDGLDFADTVLRYKAADPRLAGTDRKPGDSLLREHLTAADLLGALDVRAGTNLRTRAANERKLQRWSKSVLHAEKIAKRTGQPFVIPPAPLLEPEEASARTCEEFARQTKALFTTAAAHGLITESPWTAAVDDATIRPAKVHYTTKNVLNRHQVERIAAGIAAHTRTSRTPDYAIVHVDGRRYLAMVLLAGIDGPRPEETIALRLSWIDDRPGRGMRIGIRGGEVDQPKKLTGANRARTSVELKHRGPDEIRWIDVDVDVAAALRAHIDEFVPTPDPTSTDDEKRDPHVFTTHWGRPVDLSNFAEKWWKPVVSTLFDNPQERRFVGCTFHRLRAAAITGWLRDRGFTTYQAAMKAGCSRGMIEDHYAGVLDEIDYDERQKNQREVPVVSDLDDVALTALLAQLTAEFQQRSLRTG